MPDAGSSVILIPRPQRITYTGGTIARRDLARVSYVTVSRSSLPSPSSESYRITISDSSVIVESAGSAASMRAAATMTQLQNLPDESLPTMVIEDWPSFATRAVMLDVSRDRIPTMDRLFEFVLQMRQLKLNHLQLYTEHTFAYQGHEEIWRGWSPITIEEVKHLDGFCRLHDIELSANQNCFGHLAKWLNHPKYSHLAETTGEWVFQNETESFARSGPFSLCPTDPRSIGFVKDLLGQLLPCFQSPLVNIGCDETFDVGWGRSKVAVEKRGRATVYFDFVQQIAEVVRSHGKRPMFWADIALTHPEAIHLIPEHMIGLAWGYEPDASFGAWCSALRNAGRDAWVCPGTSSWRSITGRTTERRANIRRAAREGAANGASGFLITDWGDSGHHQQWPIALAALAEAADAAWNATNLDECDPRATSLHVFGDASLRLGPWLDTLGDVDLPMRVRGGRVNPGESPTHLRNSSVLFCDLHMPDRPLPRDDEKLRRGLNSIPTALWEHTVGAVHGLSAGKTAVSGTLNDELSHTLDVACFAAVRGLWRRTGKYSARDRKELAGWLRTILARHRELWALRSRPGGLEDSCGFYQRIIDELEAS